ncbi:STAS domain-containing protein, partial [Dehalococcoidia bacterium]|nr:STAS domain-containing protein [Dehalococcoidia bacterium]
VLKIGDFLITSIQVSLHDKLALAFQENVLRRIDQTNARGLIIDITAVDVVDSFITRILVETAAMAGMMGAKTILVGLQPEVAITLVEFGTELKGIYPSLDLERGLALLQQMVNGDRRR